MKQKIHNEWFRPVSLGNRKSCPNCKVKLTGSIWSWGEYVRAKWRTIQYFCEDCFPSINKLLIDHSKDCGCNFALKGYNCSLPEWLNLEKETCGTHLKNSKVNS